MISDIVQAVQDTAYSLSVNPSSAEDDLRILKDALVNYFIVKDVGATLISVDKDPRRVFPKNGTDFSLEESQKYVGGNIEVIDVRDGSDFFMIINDDGKYTKEPNHAATAIARQTNSIFPNDYICGDVILCHTSMLK